MGGAFCLACIKEFVVYCIIACVMMLNYYHMGQIDRQTDGKDTPVSSAIKVTITII